MDRELFSEVSAIVAQMRDQTPIKSQFTDSDIVLAYLWAVRHDRPVSWACRSRNWPLWARRRRFPAEPTMSRRLRTPSVLALLDRIESCCQPRATDAALIIDRKGRQGVRMNYSYRRVGGASNRHRHVFAARVFPSEPGRVAPVHVRNGSAVRCAMDGYWYAKANRADTARLAASLTPSPPDEDPHPNPLPGQHLF